MMMMVVVVMVHRPGVMVMVMMHRLGVMVMGTMMRMVVVLMMSYIMSHICTVSSILGLVVLLISTDLKTEYYY